MTTFYIVRHGESEANVKKIVQGASIDTGLTEKGREQALALAEALNGIIFDAIYSSDAKRAKETADIIGEKYHLQVISTPKIRERKFGKYEGMDMNEYLALHKNFDALTLDEKFDHKLDVEHESNREGVHRLIEFLEETAEKHPDRAILVVTHGGLIRPFLIHVGIGDFTSIGGLDNTGYIKVEADGKSYKVLKTKGVKTWAEKHGKL